MFLEISQNSQENTCASFLIKLQVKLLIFGISVGGEHGRHAHHVHHHQISERQYALVISLLFEVIFAKNGVYFCVLTEAATGGVLWKVFWKFYKIHRKTPVPESLLKKRLAQVFSCEFCEISKNTFFTEHLRVTASALFLFTCYEHTILTFISFRCLSKLILNYWFWKMFLIAVVSLW